MQPLNFKALEEAGPDREALVDSVRVALVNAGEAGFDTMSVVCTFARLFPDGREDQDRLAGTESVPVAQSDPARVADLALKVFSNRSPGAGFLGRIAIIFEGSGETREPLGMFERGRVQIGDPMYLPGPGGGPGGPPMQPPGAGPMYPGYDPYGPGGGVPQAGPPTVYDQYAAYPAAGGPPPYAYNPGYAPPAADSGVRDSQQAIIDHQGRLIDRMLSYMEHKDQMQDRMMGRFVELGSLFPQLMGGGSPLHPVAELVGVVAQSVLGLMEPEGGEGEMDGGVAFQVPQMPAPAQDTPFYQAPPGNPNDLHSDFAGVPPEPAAAPASSPPGPGPMSEADVVAWAQANPEAANRVARTLAPPALRKFLPKG